MLLRHLNNLLTRLRYPISLPEEIAEDLGITLSNRDTFTALVAALSASNCHPKRLYRFMERSRAESAFQHALKKEHFKSTSLYSYYFNEGWLEFCLVFDEKSCLRRLYLHHSGIKEKRGLEISLPSSTQAHI